MSEKLYFTEKGFKKLKKEIGKLTEKLEELQAQTAHVAEVGGNQYHDNFSYEQLVIQIRGIDWRLTEAHKILNQATIVDPPKNEERVAIGTRVTILRNGEKETWEIVGHGESDPDQGLISYNTPLASQLTGKRQGDYVELTIANRKTWIEILEIFIGGGDGDTK